MDTAIPELLQYGIGGGALVVGMWLGRALGAVDSRLGALEAEVRNVRREVHTLLGRPPLSG